MRYPRTIRARARWAALAVGSLTAAAALTAVAQAGPSSAATEGPCDLYAVGGTPCVAAHSTTRALFSAYRGALYQVRRASDGTTFDVGVLGRGGVANAAAQDAFCAHTSCVITVIYDQTGRGNNLTQAPPGGFNGPAAGGNDALADATAAPVTVHGHRAYGVHITPGTGYRNNHTNGIATGDDPEGMYAVLDGTSYNNGCCFDYGNAETDSHDDGNGTMEAIYFGDNTIWGTGSGSGPWIMADLENGLFSGVHTRQNVADQSVRSRFETAMVKGGHDEWAIRGGDAQSGVLTTDYTGARPNEVGGYNPMRKQGAIILGIGGDNSVGATGTFYEGVMTSGYPSEATENAVQANIAAAGYRSVPVALAAGPRVSLQSLAPEAGGQYVTHSSTDDGVGLAAVSSASTPQAKAAATFVETAGLADPSCVSFESVDFPGLYLRHENFVLHLQPNDGGTLFAQDSTFCPTPGNSGQGTSFRSVNFTDHDLRAYQGGMYLASDGGTHPWDDAASWNADTTFAVAKPWSAG